MICPFCQEELNINIANAPTLDRYRVALEQRDERIRELRAALDTIANVYISACGKQGGGDGEKGDKTK